MSTAPPPSADRPAGTATDPLTTDPWKAVEAAWGALAGVFDPELCLDVVSLGLVYDLRLEGGSLVVEITLTTPGCPVSESLPEEARAAIIDATDGAVGVDVRVVWDPPWNPSMMSEAAAAALGFGSR